jgi:predicted short-subunit dehydrogenase-like oxidoreductase (DUF2520 family)
VKSSIIIVGPGRVGGALQRGLRAAFRVQTRKHGQALRLERVPDGSWVFMCVPEVAWPELAPELELHTRRLRLVSVSGSLTPQDFTSLGLDRVETFHPLMTFAAGERDALRDVPIGVSSPALRPLVRAVGGRAFALPADRALYHAGAVIGAAGIVSTFALACELLAASGVSEPARVLAPMATRALALAQKRGAARALTGPVARGDEKTLARHRQALQSVARDDAALYESLVAAMRRLRKAANG